MTAQIPDKFIYENQPYELLNLEGQGLIEPQDYGIKPLPTNTACWRGFFSDYEIVNKQLFLKTMIIQDLDKCKPINGIMPEEEFNGYVYNNVKLLTPFTGTIVAGTGFIRDFYIHGYQEDIAYKILLEFKFEQGNLIDVKDLSILNNKKREKFKRNKNLMIYVLEAYAIVDFDGQGLIEPQDYGMEPTGWVTASGFYSVYEIINKQLFLQTMVVEEVKKCKPINGIMPGKNDYDYCGYNFYENVNLLTPFTGTIVAGKGLIREFFCINFDSRWAISYKLLLEFKFERGNLIDVKDLSILNNKKRKIFKRERLIKGFKAMLNWLCKVLFKPFS